MAVLNNNALVGAAGKGGSGGIATPQRSLRFNSSDSSHLSKTFAGAGNQKTYTLSMWIKRSKLGGKYLFGSYYSNASRYQYIGFDTTDQLVFFGGSYTTGGSTSTNVYLATTAVYRDVSSWYHLVLAVDTTQATASDRVKLFVNGVQVTAFDSSTYPAQNSESYINSIQSHYLGDWGGGASYYHDGYLANIHFIDGQPLTPSDFAYPDPVTGRWEPKAYAGSYSGNSFYLDFSDNSAATAAALGKDRSGLNNNWVPNNLSISQGNGSYTQGWTASSGFYSIYTIDKGFNGIYGPSLNEMALTLGNTLTWAPTTPVSTGSSFRIFTYPSGGYNTGYTVSIGGVSQAVSTSGSVGEWMNLTSLTGKTISTSTPLVIDTTGFGSRAGFSAIEINGVVLVDNQFSSGNDSLRDHPVSAGIDGGLGGEVSGNYCTLNPLDKSSGFTLENGNLQGKSTSSFKSARATIGMPTGKWYWEHTIETTADMTGIQPAGAYLDSHIGTSGVGDSGVALGNTVIYNQGSSSSAGGATSNGAVVSVAFDADGGKLWFRVNGGSWLSGDPAAGTSPSVSGLTGKTYFPAVTGYNNSTGMYLNFGQRPFAYTAPSGFKALCDTNLPDPLIKLPSTVMDVKRYDGNGSTQTISGLGFSPDLVWAKSRSSAAGHGLFDSVRGVSKSLSSHVPDVEGVGAAGTGVSAFNSDGFSLGPYDAAFSGNINPSASTQVAWCWDAGGQPTTDNVAGAGNVPTAGSVKINGANMTTALAGTIPATRLSANTAAGFSVVSWTGGTAGTLAHGLNAAPGLVITKSRTSTVAWRIWHSSFSSLANYIGFDTGSTGTFPSGNYWQAFTSSTIGFTGGYDNNTGSMIAYCFAPVTGYSSFGSYTGGGASGRFVHTGFRPKLVWVKAYATGSYPTVQGWYMWDSVRGTYNYNQSNLVANSSVQEGLQSDGSGIFGIGIDILSNGFCLRGSDDAATNWGSESYIYCAWAENPFKYARAR